MSRGQGIALKSSYGVCVCVCVCVCHTMTLTSLNSIIFFFNLLKANKVIKLSTNWMI